MPEKRKIYTSFHDLSPREYMYFPEGALTTGKIGSFSKIEVLHLLIAMGVLTVAFSFTISPIYRFRLSHFLLALPLSFLGIITAFFVHELSHKFLAQKYGLWAEFRMFPTGLLLSLLFGLATGFVFAAPGAVMFRGETRLYETGRIAAAGPAANILAAAVTYPLSFLLFDTMVGGINIGGIMIFICFINCLLAAFNLLPLGPFDGQKVWMWNGIVWAVLFSCALLLVGLNFYRGIMLPGL